MIFNNKETKQRSRIKINTLFLGCFVVSKPLTDGVESKLKAENL